MLTSGRRAHSALPGCTDVNNFASAARPAVPHFEALAAQSMGH